MTLHIRFQVIISNFYLSVFKMQGSIILPTKCRGTPEFLFLIVNKIWDRVSIINPTSPVGYLLEKVYYERIWFRTLNKSKVKGCNNTFIARKALLFVLRKYYAFQSKDWTHSDNSQTKNIEKQITKISI